MKYSVDKWIIKKKGLEEDLIKSIYDKIQLYFNKDRNFWCEFMKTNPEGATYQEVRVFQHILVENLMKKYQIFWDDINLLDDYIFHMSYYEDSARDVLLTPYFELAKLTEILLKAYNNESSIQLNAILGGIKNKVEIKENINIEYLHWMCDSLLHYYRQYEYRRVFGFQFKEPFHEIKKTTVIHSTQKEDGTWKEHFDDKIDVFSGLVQYTYSEKELEQIINYEKEDYTSSVKHYNNLLKIKLKDIIETLREKNIFQTYLKTISTNEACFLYDTYVALETIKVDDTMSNQEKFQFIKRWLR